ncbi:universal stress protein [Acidovorax radicis]|jgi:nucleotide-binding universal stress UspA family protein|uniref:universal stress protein n=1 Tax=Acidovorax radicis TaxID=758826 RepID=UPI001CF8D7A1|nr:universal stress protein [Acidovorax radicis]UCU98786.1 universal stress protein [Acidovorax radicis]
MLKILIAVDGSEPSLDGVHHALTLMRQGLKASVVLAHVQEPATLYELVTTRDPDLIAAASLEAGEHLMAPARALLDAAGIPYETDVGVGDAAHTLVDMIESSGCDMVVIGAKGQGAITSALLGSVSQEVAHASPVPVTIVKHAEVPDAAEGDVAEDTDA